MTLTEDTYSGSFFFYYQQLVWGTKPGHKLPDPAPGLCAGFQGSAGDLWCPWLADAPVRSLPPSSQGIVLCVCVQTSTTQKQGPTGLGLDAAIGQLRVPQGLVDTPWCRGLDREGEPHGRPGPVKRSLGSQEPQAPCPSETPAAQGSFCPNTEGGQQCKAMSSTTRRRRRREEDAEGGHRAWAAPSSPQRPRGREGSTGLEPREL